VAKPLHRQCPEPGARKGVAGRGSLDDGRHLGSFSCASRFTRAWQSGLGDLRGFEWCASIIRVPEEATGVPEVRKSARTTIGKTTPSAVDAPTRGVRAAHQSESHWREPGDPSDKRV
jgi:hypothetical protein